METKKDNVCMANDADVIKTETVAVVNGGLTDNEMFFGLESSGYDFSNGFINWMLWFKGSEVTRQYIVFKMFQRQQKAEEGKNVEEKPLPEVPQMSEAVEEKEEEREKIPLVGNLFKTHRKILFASDSGISKSLFVVFLALRGFTLKAISKACFFTLEDHDGQQRPRYTEGLKGYPITIIDPKIFRQREEQLLSKLTADANQQAYCYAKYPVLKQWERAVNYSLQEHGIKNNAIPPRLVVFLDLMNEMILQGCDFIVLDSLAEIFGNTDHLSRAIVNLFLESVSKTGITFVVIHHINYSKTIRSSKDLVGCFDSAYILEEVEKEKANGITKLLVKNVKKRYDNEQPLLIQRTRITEYTASYELLDNAEYQPLINSSGKLLKESVMEYIQKSGRTGCYFDDLVKAMKVIRTGTSSGSIQNRLRELRKERLIAAVDTP